MCMCALCISDVTLFRRVPRVEALNVGRLCLTNAHLAFEPKRDARAEPGMTNKTSITKEAKRTIKPGMTDSMPLINVGKAQDPMDS